MKNIQKTLTKNTKLYAWMNIDKTFKEFFCVWNCFTKNQILFEFDATVDFAKKIFDNSNTLDKYIQNWNPIFVN